MVLSHVDGCQGSDRDLLALRRVCRRWNDLLLTPAPWRSRWELRSEGWPDAAVLRVLPALDKVLVSIWCDKDDAHFDSGLLGTLAESSCEVSLNQRSYLESCTRLSIGPTNKNVSPIS